MENCEIYKFVKKIIMNGVQKKLSHNKIIEGIDKYIDLLQEQRLIDSEYYKFIKVFERYLELITEKGMSVDYVYNLVKKAGSTEFTSNKNVNTSNNTDNTTTDNINTRSPIMGSCPRKASLPNPCHSSSYSTSSCHSDNYSSNACSRGIQKTYGGCSSSRGSSRC